MSNTVSFTIHIKDFSFVSNNYISRLPGFALHHKPIPQKATKYYHIFFIFFFLTKVGTNRGSENTDIGGAAQVLRLSSIAARHDVTTHYQTDL